VRILIVNKFARITGGADRYCLELTRGLRDRGHDVQWLSTEHAENVETSGAFIPLRVSHATRGNLAFGRRAQVAGEAFWNRAAARSLAELCRSFRPDVVHLNKLYPQLSVAPAVIAARRRIPIVQTIHDYEFVSASSTDPGGGAVDRDDSVRAFRCLNTALFQVKRHAHAPRVGSWIAISASIARTYAGFGIDAVVIRHGVTQQAVLARGDRGGIVFVGRLTKPKGAQTLPDLARALPGIPLSVFGDGVLRGWLEAQARSVPNLEIHGWVADATVRAAVSHAVALVVPSVWPEPAGLVALEAFAVGTPVVAFDVGGLADYVRAAGGGRLVAPDVQNMAVATRQLLDDDGTWSALSAAGWRSTAAELSLDRHVSQMESVYAETMQSDPDAAQRRTPARGPGA
jgi:glycosyltransferase involved in cell wall biosynthesis